MGVRWGAVIVAVATTVAVTGTAFAAGQQPVQIAASKARTVKPSGASKAAECAWIGKRIIQLLSRDDVVTAGEFHQFYTAFGCSEAHLGAAFGCTVEGATGGSDSCANRPECVSLCWTSPTASTLDKQAKEKPAETPKSKPAAREKTPAKTLVVPQSGAYGKAK